MTLQSLFKTKPIYNKHIFGTSVLYNPERDCFLLIYHIKEDNGSYSLITHWLDLLGLVIELNPKTDELVIKIVDESVYICEL